MYPLFLTVNIVWFVQSPDLFAFGDARGRGEQNSRENNDTCTNYNANQSPAAVKQNIVTHNMCLII